MKKIPAYLCSAVFLVLFFALPHTAAAFAIRSGGDVSVPQGETIDGTLLIFGQTININGDVKGDVICAGQTVNINGNVDGDVICAGQTVTVLNSVAGSVRAAGQSVNIGGKVGRNMTVAGQTVTNNSEISGEMLFASQSAIIGGAVSKNVIGAAESINVNGSIGGDAQFKNQNLNIGKSAIIGGELSYESANEAAVEPGSQIAKGMRRSLPPVEENGLPVQYKKEAAQEKIIWKIIELAVYLAAGLLFAALFKNQTKKGVELMLSKPGRSFGIGLLILILVPLAAILFAITVIGIPLALLAGVLYAAALFFSRIFVAIAAGRKLTQKYFKNKADSLPMQAFIGIIGLWVLFAIPVIGGISALAATIWGLGGIYYMLRKQAAG